MKRAVKEFMIPDFVKSSTNLCMCVRVFWLVDVEFLMKCRVVMIAVAPICLASLRNCLANNFSDGGGPNEATTITRRAVNWRNRVVRVRSIVCFLGVECCMNEDAGKGLFKIIFPLDHYVVARELLDFGRRWCRSTVVPALYRMINEAKGRSHHLRSNIDYMILCVLLSANIVLSLYGQQNLY